MTYPETDAEDYYKTKVLIAETEQNRTEPKITETQTMI